MLELARFYGDDGSAVAPVLESLTAAFGRDVIPIELPIGAEKNLSGVVDLVRMKAYTYELGGNGKGKETEIPANMKAQVQEAHEMREEHVARQS